MKTRRYFADIPWFTESSIPESKQYDTLRVGLFTQRIRVNCPNVSGHDLSSSQRMKSLAVDCRSGSQRDGLSPKQRKPDYQERDRVIE